MNDLEYLSDLRAELVTVASRYEHQAATRPTSERLRRIFRPRLAGFVAIATVGCLAVGLIASRIVDSGSSTTSATGTHTTQLQPGLRGLGAPFSIAHPLQKSHPVTSRQAASALGISTLPLPSATSVSSAPIGTISASVGRHATKGTPAIVAVSYPQAQVVVEYQTPVPYANPLAFYNTYVAQIPSSLPDLASVGSIAGSPALLLQLDKGSGGQNPASIEFVHSGLKIAVIGFHPTDNLRPIAESIAAR